MQCLTMPISYENKVMPTCVIQDIYLVAYQCLEHSQQAGETGWRQQILWRSCLTSSHMRSNLSSRHDRILAVKHAEYAEQPRQA
jgi:hypothetical protein